MKRLVLLIFASILTLSAQFAIAQQTNKQITLNDLFIDGTFDYNTVRGLRSMNDGIHYTTLDERTKIVKYSYQTGNVVETVLDVSNSSQIRGLSGYDFSNDETKILLTTNRKGIYRRSYTASYYVWDLKTKQLTPVSDSPQQLATFSPDGSKVAFVRNNNIYVKDLASNQETQITTDGKKNEIINGAPDWVYEEEFEFARAYEWAPDGSSIAYMRFDESKVPQFSMAVYKGMKPEIADNALYPENRVFKYPKAGEANSKLSVHVYQLADKKTVAMEIGNLEYIPRIRWTNDPKTLSVFRLNRHQNKLEVLFCEAATGKSKVVYVDENKCYIDEAYFDDLTYLDDNKSFVVLSERDGYNHIYLFDLMGNLVRQLTTGKWDVTKFIGYDSKNKLFYYESAEESPLRRSVYSIDIMAKKKVKLTTGQGTNSADFSKTYQYFINTFSNINTPPIVTLYDSKGKVIRVLEDNKGLIDKVNEYGGVRREFFTFTTSDSVQLNGWMIKPPNFDPETEYPVFMTQYSGPNSQTVTDTWDFDWSNMIAQHGYIVLSVDGRGTGARGDAFRKITYLQLGKYETIDQIETVKYLRTLPYVDATRVGIFGWSYGGFMAASCLTKGADYFKLGISVAPVTNWRYYDNIYTERFMRTPQENPKGYDDNSPINHADKLQGKFLLVHGTADDNVHFQNSTEFAEALVQANKQFTMQFYTNRNHGIYGGNTTMHLYTLMTNFIMDNL